MTGDTDGRLRDALHDLASAQPFEPDPVTIGRRARRANRRSRMVRGAAGVGTAAAIAAAVAVAGPGSSSHTATVRTASGVAQPAQTKKPDLLGQLSNMLLASQSKPAGDATLEIQTETLRGKTYRSYDIYTDSGSYLWSSTPAGVIAQARGQSPGGELAQEIAHGTQQFDAYVAAAKQATTGSLAAAETAMQEAGLPPGSKPATPNEAQQQALGMTASGMAEDYIWNNSRAALLAGAGNPTVRAGVLRLLSGLPNVTVAQTTTNGQPTLTITASAAAAGAPGDNSTHEQLVIGAFTGIPISDAMWAVGDPNDAWTMTFQVSRVTLADVAAGKL